VLSLILVLLLVWFVVTVFLAAWTLWFQPYIYTESVQGMAWRAPAAGTAIFLTVLVWVYFDYQHPEEYSTFWEFSPVEYYEYPKLIVPQRGGKEDEYKRVRRGRGFVYMRGDRPLPTRPDKVIAVRENGDRDFYSPDRDENGKFKAAEGQSLLYRDPAGRVMTEGQLGTISVFYPSRLILNLLLNFTHLAAWFLCLWLLLRYQWAHALGLAVVLWVVMILFILPQVLKRTEDVARQRRPPAAQTAAREDRGILLDATAANG
jgi:hypothetical protein